jgi:predicted ATP-binding protein involved in virulence
MTLGDEEFEKTERALLRLLRLEAGEELVRADGDVLVRAAGQRLEEAVSLDQLSDGYQAVIAMAGDIMELLSPKRIDMEAAEGLVLVDEIGSHLHPRWKMQAVARLRESFPKLQFVATTHEPLVLRGLRDGLDRVIVLRRDSKGRVVLVPDLPSVEALRIDQLLTSPHFGLYSTMDEATEALFNEYYLLLARPDRSAEQEQRLTELRLQLDTRDQLGANRRESLMLEAIDRYLAREADTLREGGQPLLKQQTSDRLAAILDEGEGTP